MNVSRTRARVVGALAAALLLFSLPGRTGAGSSGGRAGGADAWELYRGLMDGGSVTYVVPPETDLAPLETAVRILEKISHLEGRIVVHGAEASDGGRGARVVFGGFDHPAARDLAKQLGIEPKPVGFRYAGRSYAHDHDAVVATFEDPFRPGRPVTLYFGNDTAGLVLLLGDPMPAWKPGARVFRDGVVDRIAPLGAGGQWSYAFEEILGRSRIAREAEERSLRVNRIVLSIPPELDQATVDAYLVEVERARRQVKDWAAPAEKLPLLRITLYAHPEDMAELVRQQDLGWHDAFSGDVHALLAPGLPNDAGLGSAYATARALLGEPAEAWMLEGAAVAATGHWWGRPLQAWAGWLHRAGLVLPLEELVDPSAAARYSPHIVAPLRAVLFELLLATRGAEELQRLWRGEREFTVDSQLTGVFMKRLDSTLRGLGPAMDVLADYGLQRARTGAFRNGIVFQREGDPLGGYASRAAGASLRRAAEHGANALALSVSGFQDPGFPAPELRSSRGGRPASDTDVALAQSVAYGRALGMRSMLSPQLLVTPWGGLAGQRVLVEMEDWEEFFDALERCVVHYALVAELLRCELLCLAGDLPSAIGTLDVGAYYPREDIQDFDELSELAKLDEQALAELYHLDPENELDAKILEIQQYKREAWPELVAKVRKAFSGGLTYQSWWLSPRPSFGAELDFLGHNMFDPLFTSGSGQVATEAEMVVRRIASILARASDTAQQFGKPALVVAGYTSTEQPWVNPVSPRGRSDVDEQLRMYEILADALRRQEWLADRLQGVFIWCWSTDPEAGGHGDRGFTPQNKPAEAALEQIFGVR